jgi:ubiquinone/menaquinone biosynthesis C-methylase UbiE
MTDDTGRKRAAADAFDEHASAYVDSRVHRMGDDLARLADWCADADRALDVATGAGHTAAAVWDRVDEQRESTERGAVTDGNRDRGVDGVVAADAAPSMVETATDENPGLVGVVADAEALPFADDAFDAVTCRIAAHHFPDPEAFVREVARVTEPGGTFAFEDNIAPEDDALDAFLNDVERLRDPTHHRSHRESEWTAWVEAAGFSVEETRVVTKEIGYASWVEQLDTPAENRRELRERFADPPEGATDLYEITHEDGDLVSFSNLKVLLRATR